MNNIGLDQPLSFLAVYRAAKGEMNTQIYLLTRYEPGSLQEYITLVVKLSQVRDEFMEVTTAHMEIEERPYQRRCITQIKLGVKRIDRLIKRYTQIVEEDYGAKTS